MRIHKPESEWQLFYLSTQRSRFLYSLDMHNEPTGLTVVIRDEGILKINTRFNLMLHIDLLEEGIYQLVDV